MKTVLITGGTGLVGKRLTELLLEKGYKVSILSRTAKKSDTINHFTWNIDKKEIDKQAVLTADYVIHLAGTSVADKRWTASRKKSIIDSRVESANLIYDVAKAENHTLKAFISASGTNYYGTLTSDKIFKETDAPADDFLGEVCQLWEAAADKFKDLNTRVVKLRTGIVLSKNGGAFEKMYTPIKIGVGSALGSGKQYMPWIHVDDLCEMYIQSIENEQLIDAYNAISPEHINNKNFTKQTAKFINKSLWMPNVPAFMLQLIFGKMSKIITTGSRMSSEKITKTGFSFQYPTLKKALENLIG